MILADAGAPIAELAITTLRRLDFSAVVDAVTVAAVEYAVADADAATVPVATVGRTFRAGGVLIGPMREALRRAEPRAELTVPQLAPVGGALWLAARLAGVEHLLDPGYWQPPSNQRNHWLTDDGAGLDRRSRSTSTPRHVATSRESALRSRRGRDPRRARRRTSQTVVANG